jgi:hypothetical protein
MTTRSIRFPGMHIAESTANRIQNVAAGIPSHSAPVVAPVLPDVGAEGEALDAQLKTPPAPTELPGGADGAIVGAALNGDSLSTAAVSPLLGI